MNNYNKNIDIGININATLAGTFPSNAAFIRLATLTCSVPSSFRYKLS